MDIVGLIKIGLVEIFYSIKRMIYNFRNKTKIDKHIDKELKEKGIFIYKNFLDREETEKLITEAEKTKKNHQESIVTESNGADKRIYGIDLINKNFQIEKLKYLEEIPKRYYGTNEISQFILYGEIHATERNLGSGNGWHRDSAFRPQIKFLIYLTDVGINNGPFEYIEGTHGLISLLSQSKNTEFSKTRYSDKEIDNLLRRKNLRSKKIIGNAGDMVIVNTRGLHRGSPLDIGRRVAITNYIFDQEIPKKIPLAKHIK